MSDVKRKKLPNRRERVERVEVEIGGPRAQRYVLTLGEYDDGKLGEIFIDGDRSTDEGMRAALNLLAISVSIGLQYGVPLEEFVDAFVHTKFQPEGMVFGSDFVKFTSSPADWIFRELGIRYLDRRELASGGIGVFNDDELEDVHGGYDQGTGTYEEPSS